MNVWKKNRVLVTANTGRFPTFIILDNYMYKTNASTFPLDIVTADCFKSMIISRPSNSFPARAHESLDRSIPEIFFLTTKRALNKGSVRLAPVDLTTGERSHDLGSVNLGI